VGERVGQRHAPEPAGPVVPVAGQHPAHVLPQLRLDRLGERRPSVLAALAVADHDSVVAAVEVLDPQPQAFEQPQPGVVLQQGDQAVGPVQPGDDPLDLLGCQYHRQPPGSVRPDHAAEPVQSV
jgi:hypothetical protein